MGEVRTYRPEMRGIPRAVGNRMAVGGRCGPASCGKFLIRFRQGAFVTSYRFKTDFQTQLKAAGALKKDSLKEPERASRSDAERASRGHALPHFRAAVAHQSQQRNHQQNDAGLSDFHSAIEGEQRPPERMAGQHHLPEHAGKTEPVDEPEAESEKQARVVPLLAGSLRDGGGVQPVQPVDGGAAGGVRRGIHRADASPG